MKQLVRLRIKPSRDGSSFKYFIDFLDENGKRVRKSLGHADRKKAEGQRAQFERELRMGIVEPDSMKLSDFLSDCLVRTRRQVTEATLQEYDSTMRQFIEVAGDIDIRSIQHMHGERYIQACLDGGNRPATVSKKVGNMKRLFQLAVERGQLEKNPFRYVRKPKSSPGEIHTFTDEECRMMVKVAKDSQVGTPFRWDILILTALCTGMRRGELLNTTWRDIDFARQMIRVSPKDDTEHTWEWHIKDTDRRKVPLTDEVVKLLAEHQAEQPEGYPYVFVPSGRYDRIQQTRQAGEWTVRQGKCPAGNFRRQWLIILSRANIDEGTFHDLRRTCITSWFAHGLSEYEVMIMAGHSSFETTRKFYLAIRNDLIDRARQASTEAMETIFGTHLARTPKNPAQKNSYQA
jgi:integrase